MIREGIMTRSFRLRPGFLYVLSFFLLAACSHAQTVQIVDMIPQAQSNETIRDSEPNISVNPVNPQQIAATAFTPDPMASGNSPIFASSDGGNTWNLNSVILPGAGCGSTATCDATLRFGGSSSILYAGILNGTTTNLNILRTNNFLSNMLMTVLVNRANDDQPWVQAATVLEGAGTGSDRVYVGNNDTALRIANGGSGRTATEDFSLDAATPAPPAGFSPHVIEVRNTCDEDGPSIRTAGHLDGTVYAAFLDLTAGCTFTVGSINTADLVVVRDDNWGAGANPFQNLKDSNDTNFGQRVVTGRQIVWLSTLGTQRVGSHVAIAVDPNHSRTVYVAWGDGNTAANYTLHVRHSADGGQSWDANDLRTIASATNPGLAINSHGKLGFLYQKLINNRWQTHLERTVDNFTNIADLVLADVPDQNGTYGGSNPIGDYANVIAVGKDFYGVFSGNNTPDLNNFPNNVTYQRFADFNSHQLFADMAHTMLVGVSIDPFFFHVTELSGDQDFYVRDWTDTMASHDQGQEPSTKTDFWDFSDVWNRATNSPGAPNGNDQFATDPMQAGTGTLGDNYAFVRVHRNATGSAANVTAHFLVSPFGTGSNFQNASNNPDSALAFAANDPELTMTSGYQWHQDPTASTHACIAVEITGPNDPIIPPGLVGTAPGWPAGVAIVEDNNKAQRNLDVNNSMSDNGAIDYAVVHNAAMFARNVELRYEAPAEVLGKIGEARVEIVGGPGKPFKSGDTITLENMMPAENRWVGLALTVPPGDAIPVNFFEIFNGRAVNGFTILTRPVSLSTAIRDNIKGHAQVFDRLAAAFRLGRAGEEGRAARRLLEEKKISAPNYMQFLRLHVKPMNIVLDGLIKDQNSTDRFGVTKTLTSLESAVTAGKTERAAAAHAVLLHQFDAFTTMLQKAKGDPADILQMVRWQKELYSTVPQLKQLKVAKFVVDESQEFIKGYGKRNAHEDTYPQMIRDLLKSFHDTADALEKQKIQLEPAIDDMEHHLSSLAQLEKAHRGYLLELERLSR
jgi:hypothetical protein